MVDWSIHTTFGAFFDGIAISTVLLGVNLAQTLFYFKNYKSDERILKYLVAVVAVMDLSQSALVLDAAYHYLVLKGKGELSIGHWSLIAQVIPVETCVVFVEGFFIMRMWKLSERNIWTLIPLIPILVGTGSGFAYAYIAFKFPAFADYRTVKVALSLCAASRTFTDITISFWMCAILHKKGNNLPSGSDGLLRWLVIYTLSTGLVTSVFTVAYMITYLTMPTNMVYIAIYLVHCKIYANSMLASLNGRKSLRSRVNVDLSSGRHGSQVQLNTIATFGNFDKS
jgi:hypothetical protein